MLADNDDDKRRSGVLDLPQGYDVERQVQINALLRQLRFYGWFPASLLVIVVGLILLRRRARRHAVG